MGQPLVSFHRGYPLLLPLPPPTTKSLPHKPSRVLLKRKHALHPQGGLNRGYIYLRVNQAELSPDFSIPGKNLKHAHRGAFTCGEGRYLA